MSASKKKQSFRFTQKTRSIAHFTCFGAYGGSGCKASLSGKVLAVHNAAVVHRVEHPDHWVRFAKEIVIEWNGPRGLT